MYAVTVLDGKVTWQEHPDPVPSARELLVRVRAAGLNGGEVALLKNHYAPDLARLGPMRLQPPSGPNILGMEVAGEVVATGPGVRRFAAGDRVMAVVSHRGQAELAVVHERLAMPVPGGLSWQEAGSVPEAFTTADDALFTHCQLEVGERVLVHGAAGGVGIAAVQLAARAGARVTATVRSPERREPVAEIGAAAGAVEIVGPDEVERPGAFDVIIEVIGAPNLPADVEALAVGGRIAVVGIEAGSLAQLDLMALNVRRARIHGTGVVLGPLEAQATAARRVEAHVLPLLATGKIRMPIEAALPMSEAAAAYEHFTARGKLGKIVLTN